MLLLLQKPACKTLANPLIYQVHSLNWPRFTSLTVLSNKPVRKSGVEQEDLKLYWKLQKMLHFLGGSTSLLFTSFLEILLITERRLTRW